MTALFNRQLLGAPPLYGEWSIWYSRKGSRVTSYEPHTRTYVHHLFTTGIRAVRAYDFSPFIILAEA